MTCKPKNGFKKVQQVQSPPQTKQTARESDESLLSKALTRHIRPVRNQRPDIEQATKTGPIPQKSKRNRVAAHLRTTQTASKSQVDSQIRGTGSVDMTCQHRLPLSQSIKADLVIKESNDAEVQHPDPRHGPMYITFQSKCQETAR